MKKQPDPESIPQQAGRSSLDPAPEGLERMRQLLASWHLYEEHDADPDALAHIRTYMKHGVDLHCIYCEVDSHFKVRALTQQVSSRWRELAIEDDDISVTLMCSRDAGHQYNVFLRIHNKKIMKVGQFPPQADLVSSGLAKYDKVSKQDRKELARAVGLASHGIGIGSFVYLRRIFERQLIAAADRRSAAEATFNRDAWTRERIDSKIEQLKDYLPSFLYEIRTQLYGVLSKGIHELAEEECRGSFDVVRSAIELILDEIIASQEQEKKKREIAGLLSQAHAKHK